MMFGLQLASMVGVASAGRLHNALALRTQSLAEVSAGAYYGHPDCQCIGFDDVKGDTIVHIDKSTTATYPADLGARCSAWDDNRYPKSCTDKDGDPGKGKGWCAQQWCYVDPCKCSIPVLPKTSSYLPDATYQGKTLYYSYATCGGKDTFTKKEHQAACVNQKTAGDCLALDKCAWSGGRCGGKEIMGACKAKMHGFTWGMGNCRCVGIDGQEGSMVANLGKGKEGKYPADIGATCKAWDKENHPDCQGDSLTKPSWCTQAWCYVDPCSCQLEVPPKTSAYFPEASFQGKPVYYSYATCGSVDYWTEDNHKSACVNQKSENACASMKDDKCAWANGQCMGKEAAGVCGEAPKERKATKSGTSVPAPVAVVAMISLLGMLRA